MEVLRRIQQILLRDFPLLESNIISSSEVLHVFAPKSDLDGLNYLPNFHLIFHVHSDLETVILKLVTFHGKTVDSVLFKKDAEQRFPEQIRLFVEDFSRSIKLCQGTVKNLSDFSGDCLTEFLNDSIVVRSIQCKFKLTTGSTKCEECAKIAVKVEVDVVKDNPYDNEQEDESMIENGDFYDNDPEAWGVTVFKKDEPFETYQSTETDFKPAKRMTKVKKNQAVPGVKCEPILEPFDEEEDKRRKARLKLLREKRLGKQSGRPTDAESTKEKFRAKCKVCLRLYRSKPRYVEDQTKHAKYFDMEGSMECPMCRITLKKQEMTGHFAQKHSELEQTTCCIGCGLVMPNKDESLRKHIVKFHHNQNICETCGRVFNDPRLFEIHVNSAHSDVKDHFCDRCGKAFGHRRLLEKHLSHACSMEEWSCPICSKVFSCKDKLKFHLATHCDLKPFVCRYCPYSSNKCDNICIHVKKVHKMRGFRDDAEVREDVLKLQKQFISENLAKVDSPHIRKPYQRNDSGAAHPYSKAMQVPQVCHLCGKTYASGDSIRRHLDLHSGKRPFKCKICGYSALKASIITVRHFTVFHSDEGLSETDILAVDETELEEMREFSTREFLNLTPAIIE